MKKRFVDNRPIIYRKTTDGEINLLDGLLRKIETEFVLNMVWIWIVIVIVLYISVSGTVFMVRNPLAPGYTFLYRNPIKVFTFQKADEYQPTYENLMRLYPEAFKTKR